MLNAFQGPLRWALAVAGAWIGFAVVMRQPGHPTEAELQNNILLATELPFTLWFALRLVDNLAEVWAKRASETDSTFDDQLVPIVRAALKVFLVAVCVVMVIQNLGGEVSSLLAGFGIGGAAVALASKDTIANLFGSIVIFVDRPFQIGDWVEIGSHEGTVEEVGLRVTRIRTFANSLITVPNSALTTSAINNWSRMNKRRIKLTIGLTYDTSPQRMRDALEALRDCLRRDARIDQGFWLVNFTDLGPSSLDVFVYCFTVTTSWEEYMQTREELLLAFMDAVSQLGLSFAFPTQTVHVDSFPTERVDSLRPNP
ncbi:MAG: mechanosensitive ion channel family protein [Myxococcales bacterium FL481]|nr:MAG: mechanosensitive ion channel family protein [Myxococcales bacterium FL481]